MESWKRMAGWIRRVYSEVLLKQSGQVAEGAELFDWPTPILKHSLKEFLANFRLAMEIGVIAVLN